MTMRRLIGALALLPLLSVAPGASAAQERGEPARPSEAARPAQGYLGLLLEPADERRVVVVRDVQRRSPAEKAGVLRGDTLVRLNGRPAADVVRGFGVRPGETVALDLRRAGAARTVRLVAAPRLQNVVVIRRGGEEHTLDLDDIRERISRHADTLAVHLDTLVTRMDSLRRHLEVLPRMVMRMDPDLEREIRETLPFSIEIGSRGIAGAELTQLNPGLGRYFRTRKGLLTLRVAPESPAAKAGLEAGDVVLRVDGAEVETLPALREAVAHNRQGAVILQVLRDGRQHNLLLRRQPPTSTWGPASAPPFPFLVPVSR